MMTGPIGKAAIKWGVAEVERTLQSVSVTTGPAEGPGVYDVLFTNTKGVVVPAGVVEEILKKVTPVAEYRRENGLYVADVKLSVFHRQGPSP